MKKISVSSLMNRTPPADLIEADQATWLPAKTLCLSLGSKRKSCIHLQCQISKIEEYSRSVFVPYTGGG